MRTPDEALAWLERQRASGSTAWHNLCESLQRQAYGLPAHYSSAELHARAIPGTYRHGLETPRRGDLVLYLNGGAGHIVTCTGHGWDCYTNDYGGRGRVTIADARNLASWCHASSWWVADAWWSASAYRLTHTPTPTPPPTGGPTVKDAGMFLAEVKYGTNSTSYWIVGPNGTVNVGGDEAASWTGARCKVNDEATWRRILSRYPQ